jgi:hypothetical protein
LTVRTSEITAAQNERRYRHIVEVPIPPNGLGATLVAMHAFHRERGLELRRGRGRRREECDYVRWCFADRTDAEDFQKRFGGNTINSAASRQ